MLTQSRLLRAAGMAAVVVLAGCSGGESTRSADPARSTGGAAAGEAIGGAAAGAGGPGGAATGAGVDGGAGAGGGQVAQGGETSAARGPDGQVLPGGGGGAPGSASPAAQGGAGGPGAGGGRAAAPGSASVAGGGFCQAERDMEAGLRSLDPGAPPAQLRASVGASRATFPPALATAPPEVAGDVRVVTDAYGRLFGALEQAGYDASRVSIGELQGFSPSAVDGASDRLQAYVRASCQREG